MITKIDSISNFAVFDSFEWKSQCRDNGNNIAKFKKLNIIYGRNYSGKTTLSRIFRSFEKGILPDKYSQAEFRLSHDEDETMSHSNLNSHSYNIRVYNKDFVDENLKWLKDEQESIKPFAILGEQNIEIEKLIKEKEEELGNEELKTGFRYELCEKRIERSKMANKLSAADDSLNDKLRKKANDDIKRNPLYDDVDYTITKIKADIDSLKGNCRELLTEKQTEDKKSLLKEQIKNNRSQITVYNPCFQKIFQQTPELLKKEIMPTKSIQDLLCNASLQEWVRMGIEYHKDKRERCAFCNGNLDNDLWNKLDSHFNKESEDLRIDIRDLIKTIKDEETSIDNLSFPQNLNFYSTFHGDYEKWENEWKNKKQNYISTMDTLVKSLKAREKDIFNVQPMPECKDVSIDIINLQNTINTLISDNNQKTNTLKQDQNKDREDLRLNEVAEFIKAIDYDVERKKIQVLREEGQKLETEYDLIQNNIEKNELKIEELKISLKDERKGADKVNEYLNHFFAHEGLKLKAVEETESDGYKFQVMRNGKIAYNLSEGENSLVAFCYFMAKLEDIDTKGRELIIWIDDPVSSLDSNHIFFVFSLIESVIAKPIKNDNESNSYGYQQLFISTHNLDFLKYLKKLSMPKDQSEYFIIERTKTNSRIALMPNYLKNYVTEFNYLFHQIYKCSKADNTNVGHDCFYNFGNNLRKFLEAFLFYKYPVHEHGDTKKLEMFFGGDSNSVALTNRISNELSHLEQIFDRSMKPVEIPEIPKLADCVIKTIESKDKEQYDALLKSIGEDD